MTLSITERNANTLGRSENCPASMRDISRMSLISAINASPDWRAVSSNACSGPDSPLSTNKVRLLSSAFSGVRISCDTIATKRDIALFAVSANALASRSARSAVFRTVMST